MLKRLMSIASSSSENAGSGTSRKTRTRPSQLSSPTMLLAMGKVARGDSAGLVSEVARATIAECGAENVANSAEAAHIVVSMFNHSCCNCCLVIAELDSSW